MTAALDAIARGWAPLPIYPRGKRPMVDAWQRYRATGEEVARWDPGANLGVLLGEPSGWLVDVDLDVPEAAELAPRYLPSTWVFGRASKRESHRLYIARGAATRQFKADTMLLELRSTGAQTVIPQSIHTGGEVIEWDPDHCDATDAPREIGAGDLLRRCAALACATLARRAGMSIEESIAWEQSQRAPEPRGPSTSRASASRVDIVDRARRYLDKMPLAVAGSGGHAALWAATLAMVRGFALAEDDARALLEDYSARCSPPWAEREIEHKIKQASERATLPLGYLIEGAR